jgi:hypothetical protein
MNLFRTARSIGFALAAFVCSVAAAQTIPTPPSWYHYSWDIPVLRGLYMPSDNGTLGSLAVGFTDDERRILGGAVVFYDNVGNPVTHALGGQVTFNDDATIQATGVIARTGVIEYTLSDGSCRTCAPHPRQQYATNDVETFEWTSPRSGNYTVNGVTNHMVEALSGPPLVGSTDLSGTWMLVWRLDDLYYGGATPNGVHQEYVAIVRLTLVTEARTYRTEVHTQPGIPPFGTVALPTPDARQYDVTCVGSGCSLVALGDGQSQLVILWVNSDDVGRLMPVRVSGSGSTTTYTVIDSGRELARVYATDSKIVGRRAYYPSFPAYSIEEFLLTRIGSDTLSGAWQQPGCSIDPTVPDCNPGG